MSGKSAQCVQRALRPGERDVTQQIFQRAPQGRGARKAIDNQTAQLKEQAAQIQKVSARLEASKPAPQVVNNP
jgi:hypothetical protein